MKSGTAIGQDKGASSPISFTIKIIKSRPSTVLRIARLQRVHGTLNQMEKRIDKIHSSDERKQTSNRKQGEKVEEDPPRIPPKPGKQKGKKEKDEEKEEEKEQGKGGRRSRNKGRNRGRSRGPAHPQWASS